MIESGSTTLGTVVQQTGGFIQTGPFGSQLHASDYTTDGTPLVMPTNIGDNTITEDGIARVGEKDVHRLSKHQLRAGDIVFGRRGDIGRRSIVRSAQAGWLCGTGCLALRFGKDLAQVNPEYVAHYVGTALPRRWLVDNAVGGTMANLNTQILGSLPVLLPAKAEQDHVVAAIDDVSILIASLECLVAKKRAIKRGMMQELLTGRTRLPEFSDPWQPVKLGDVCAVDPEIMNAGLAPRELEIDYISLEDVSRGKLLGWTRVSFGVAPSRARRVVRVNDVLFGTVRPNFQSHTKYSGGLPRPVASTGFAVIRAAPCLAFSSFIAHWILSGDVSDQVERIIAGSNYPAISSSDVRNFDVLLPSYKEQEAIGKVLDDADIEIATLEHRLEAIRAIKQGMMQELLTGHTRLPIGEVTE